MPILRVGGTKGPSYGDSSFRTSALRRAAILAGILERIGIIPVTPPPVISTEISVGVGTGTNTLSYSQNDGLTWVGVGNTIFNVEGKCVVWNGTRWVAGGISTGDHTHAYSNDGKNWIGLPKLVTRVNSLVWTGTKFVGIGDTSSIVSADGISWTKYADVFTLTNQVELLATNGYRIIGIRLLKGGNVAVYSDDNGETWGTLTKTNGGVPLIPEVGAKFSDILWDGTKFIISTTIGSTFISYDGYDWNLMSNAMQKLVNSTNIVYDSLSNLYISRGNNTSKTEISKNGIDWISFDTPPILNNANHTTTHGSILITKQYVIIFLSNGKYLYSSDPLTWDGGLDPTFTWTESTSTPLIRAGFSIRSSQLNFTPRKASILVGVGSGTNTLSYSENNGLTWVGLGNTIFDVQASCAVWNGIIWVAVGQHTDGSTLAYSSNGKVWTKLGFKLSGGIFLKSVVWVGSASTFVAAGGRKVVTSTNGIDWRSTLFQPSKDINILVTDGSSIIALPDQTTTKTLLYSTDIGNTWNTVVQSDTTDLTPQSGGSFTDILWDGTRYIAIVGNFPNGATPDGSIYYNTSSLDDWSLVEVSAGGSYDGSTNIAYDAISDLYVLRSMSTAYPRTQLSKNGTNWTSFDTPPILNNANHTTTHGSILITKQYVIIFLSNGKYLYSSGPLTWDGTTGSTFTWTESTTTPLITAAFSN